MADKFIRVNGDGCLLCPACGSEWTHSEIVYVAARREDGPTNEIAVNAITGRVEANGDQAAPAGPAVGEGRRQRVAITGTCESNGHTFAIVFTQHKGVTLVEAVAPVPHETSGDPDPAAGW